MASVIIIGRSRVDSDINAHCFDETLCIRNFINMHKHTATLTCGACTECSTAIMLSLVHTPSQHRAMCLLRRPVVYSVVRRVFCETWTQVWFGCVATMCA